MSLVKRALAILVTCMFAAAAHAQTDGGYTAGQQLTAASLNSNFQRKQDYLGTSGNGALARVNGAVFVAPVLGMPTSVDLTNATGLPLSTGVTGNLGVGHLNSGTSASGTTYWAGDGTWKTPPGSVTITGSPTSGQIAKFSSSTAITGATSGTDYAPATSGSGILKGNGSGGFSAAAAGTDYAAAPSGSAILKGNGSGGFSNATSGTDYAPATSGSSILSGNGAGGHSNVTVGTCLSFTGGTLTGTCGGLTVIPGYINGLALSNDVSTPNSVIDTPVGTAADTTNAQMISVASALTKSTAGAWAAGTGANGMGNGLTIANSTWYHVCLAYNGGTTDEWFDTSVTCSNKPTGISGSLYRIIGHFKTDGSAHILAFFQVGQRIWWSAGVFDISSGALSTSGALFTLSIPPGVKVYPVVSLNNFNDPSASGTRLYAWSPTVGSTPGGSLNNYTVMLAQASATSYAQQYSGASSNTSSQIYLAASTSTAVISAFTSGWIDPSLALAP